MFQKLLKSWKKKPIKGEIVLFIRAVNDDGIYLKDKNTE